MNPPEGVPRVFISYSHDSPEHADRVLELADRLRSEGIDCHLDQYETSPPEGWPRWMPNQVEAADFVLVICTETYNLRFRGKAEAGKGLGVKWEGAIITQELYDAGANNTRFVPVVFSAADKAYIPAPLRGATHHNLAEETGYESLYRLLTNQPMTPRPDLGSLRPMPSKERSPEFFGPSTLSTVPHRPGEIDKAEESRRGIAGDQIEVIRVTDPMSQDLHEALELYSQRIPDDEQFSPSDIVRWLRDDLEEVAPNRPRDYFLVARVGDLICGCVLLHYYPLPKFGFIAYLVALEDQRGHAHSNNNISTRLMAAVNELIRARPELGDCKGFLLEVDRPSPQATEGELRQCLARIRLFGMLAEAQGFCLRAFDLSYYHPPLSSTDPETTVPMLLMYLYRTTHHSGYSTSWKQRGLLSLSMSVTLTQHHASWKKWNPASRQVGLLCAS